MSKKQETRWIQRFNNLKKALSSLTKDVELATERELTNIEQRGLIQAFEYTYELAWNTIKDFYESTGETNIQGSKDAFRLAFKRGLVSSETLLDTAKSRQMTSHSYNEETANLIYSDIIHKYYFAFNELADSLQAQKDKRGL